MRLIKYCALLLAITIQLIAGCGGGGGGGGGTTITTKTATLKFASQSANPSDLLGGFLLTATLPQGASVPTDSSGIPLANAVFLSGQFAGAVPQIIGYDSVLRKLTVNYASSNSYQLGEFITVLVTVPLSYVPSSSDVSYTFKAFAPLTGLDLPSVTATALFN